MAEAVGTFIFTFGVAAAIYQGYRGLRLAVTVGTSLFLGIVVAGTVSNGLVNPAVALGVQSWSKEYVIGPIVGALVGMNLYAILTQGFSMKMWQGASARPARATVSSRTSRTKARPARRKR